MKEFKRTFFNFFIHIFLLPKIFCKLNNGESVKGKCVYIVDDTAVYNFHRLTAEKDTVK